jgi:hypothetical protein
LEENLVTVGIKLADGKATSAGDPTKGIRQPKGRAQQIVEGEDMAVVGGNHEVALLPRRRSCWSCVGIDQRAQDFREHGLCRPLLASDHQQWIGAALLQRGQQPCHHQHEFIWRCKIQQCSEAFDRSASLRYRERQHASGATESDRWRGHDLPSVRPYLDGSPLRIGKVEIDATVMFGDPDVNRAFRAVKLGARLE